MLYGLPSTSSTNFRNNRRHAARRGVSIRSLRRAIYLAKQLEYARIRWIFANIVSDK